MVRVVTGLLAMAWSGLFTGLLLFLLLLWLIDPDFELARNALWLIRMIVSLLAAFCGWLAALIEALLASW